MKNLLICTQVVDKNSHVLGFVISWIQELAKNYDKVTVLCLQEGEHNFNSESSKIKVYSLGKEKVTSFSSRFKYILNFYKYIWKFRWEYETVFVHQNREYLLLGGIFWKLFNKKIYHWSNHYMGNWLTNIAGYFCEKVFYTSKFSYTANFKNAVQMPVGVDVSNFIGLENSNKVKNSVLFLARLDPSKYPEIILQALKEIENQNNPEYNFTATFVGSTNKVKFPNYENEILKLKNDLAFKSKVDFVGGVASSETAKYYKQNEIFINIAKSGMLDKTIYEAVVCDCIPLTTSVDFNEMIYPFIGDKLKVEQNSVNSLRDKLQYIFALSNEEKMKIRNDLKKYVLENHTLSILANRLKEEMMI